LPEEFLQKEAACAFNDGVKDRDVKQDLLIGEERTLNEAHNQVLNEGFAKGAA
jgi:hypothetical protein